MLLLQQSVKELFEWKSQFPLTVRSLVQVIQAVLGGDCWPQVLNPVSSFYCRTLLQDTMPWRSNVGKPFLPKGRVEVTSEEIDEFIQEAEDAARPFFDQAEGERFDDRTEALSSSFNGVVDDQPLEQQQFNRVLAHAISRTVSSECPTLPWESGPFKEIFGNNIGVRPRLFIPLENVDVGNEEASLAEQVAEASQGSGVQGPLWLHAVSAVVDEDFAKKQKRLRELAISKWINILQCHSLGSTVAEQILATCNLEVSEQAAQIVDAVLGVRSSSTAVSRGNALLKYLRWAAAAVFESWKR